MKYVWTRKAIAMWVKFGVFEPAHTISNVQLTETEARMPHLHGFVRNTKPGCPWMFVSENGRIFAASEDCPL